MFVSFGKLSSHHAPISADWIESSRSWWLLIGSLTILWMQYVPTLKLFKVPIQIVSAAAYYIYLTHIIFFHIFSAITDIQVPLLEVIFAVGGGVLVWQTFQWLQNWLVAVRQKKRLT
jgi:membrane-bound acyltransferase YfiQ involved in biofilm formation